ncbi:glycosyl transferase family 2 [[Bacillus thuringiensis] serovar konkukian]|nr:glycosyl transferase family 2 [Bacillus thuringiensis]MED1305546.1 glycosyl transferase family 2 [Bacillus pacificus]OUA91736.1 glycosyl transferase family 2 [[Bacillus thuringiensis] serovar konkukian]
MIKSINHLKKVNILYEQLKEIHFIMTEPFLLNIEWNAVNYEFIIRIKPESPNVIILGSGASENQRPPIFQRYTWMEDFEDTLIFYNDPTLYLGEINLGWGQGTVDRYYLNEIAIILEKIIIKMHVTKENVLFYGSSGGGFMSLILAGYIKGSSALVNNPQTILTNWYTESIKQAFNLSYPNLSIEEIEKLFAERINVIAFYNKIKYVPHIYYLQNIAAEFDMKNHLEPFITGLQQINENCMINQVKVDLYFDKHLGHIPLEKNKIMYYINLLKRKNDGLILEKEKR